MEVNKHEDDVGKLSLYKPIKSGFCYERYLDNIKCRRQRAALCRIRTSSHRLNIERGRYAKIPRDKRFCEYCVKKGEEYIEDVSHFILKCPQY